MRFSASICLGLLALTFAGATRGQSIDATSPIDTTLTRILDVTADGKPDTIFLHLKARNLASPFTWTLWIDSLGKLIYSWREDDTNIEILFHDVQYVSHCASYLDCKRVWYFHDILSELVISNYSLEGVLDRSQSNTLYALGGAYLRSCGVDAHKTEAILSGIERRLRDGTAVVLSVPTAPEGREPPMVYAPEVGLFVPIYQD